MATEALDFPRDTNIIRLPHRLAVLLRAVRIARIRRLRDRAYVDLELARTNASSHHDQNTGWVDDLAQAAQQIFLIPR